MLVLPPICQEGIDAALAGTRMSNTAWPLGFTFCPYPSGTVEQWNFLSGCVGVYFEELRLGA